MEENPNRTKKIILSIVGALGLYLLTTGVSYTAFGLLKPEDEGQGLISPVGTSEGRAKIDLSAPKTEACPINGGYFTKAEKAIWEKRRPLGVVVENHTDSRPQSGLSYADVIYEAVAEGGITRFLAIYLCGASAEDAIVGPVRSARVYYMDWVSEYSEFPLYVHSGGANNFDGLGKTNVKVRALEKISDLKWNLYNDLNEQSIGAPTFIRNTTRTGRDVAWEHTLYSSTDKLWVLAEKRGLTQVDKEGKNWDEDFVSWKFKDEEKLEDRGQVGKIEFGFWSNQPDFNVVWDYNRESNIYSRTMGGQAHKDLDNDRQIEAKTVIVQFAKEQGPLDENKHLFYETTGSGKAVAFSDGQAVNLTWKKKDRTDRTLFYDAKGKEMVFTRGPIWIEVVPLGKEVKY